MKKDKLNGWSLPSILIAHYVFWAVIVFLINLFF